MWGILGVVGETAVIITRLTDKAEQQKAIEGLFREKYSIAGIRDRNLQEKLKEAEQYRQRIQAVVDQHREGVLRDRLKRTTDQVYDWIANMVTLARRLDTYRSDPILRRDLEQCAARSGASQGTARCGARFTSTRADDDDTGLEPAADGVAE